MAQYTEAEIIQILRDADIPEKDIPMMLAIAMAESKGDSDAVGDKKLVNDKWDASIGLFQVRSLKNPDKYSKADKLRIKDKLFDPVYNAKTAYEISKKGKDYTDWSTYNDGSYREHLPSRSSRSQIRIAGGGRGKGKPITMAASGSTPNVGSDKDLKTLQGNLKDAQSKLADFESKFKRANKQGVTAESIANQKELIDSIKADIGARKKELAPGAEGVKQAKAKETQRAKESTVKASADAVAEYEKLKAASDAGKKVKTGASKAGVVYDYVSENMLNKAKERAYPTKTATPEVTAAADSATTGFQSAANGADKPAQGYGANDNADVPAVQFFDPATTKIYTGNKIAQKGYYGTRSIDEQVTLNDYLNDLRKKSPAEIEKLQQDLLDANWLKTKNYVPGKLDAYTIAGLQGLFTTIGEYNDPAQNVNNFLTAASGTGAGTGLTAKQVNGAKENIALLANQIGAELTPKQIGSLATTSLLSGWTSDVLQTKVAQLGQINFDTGTAATTKSALKQWAGDNGVNYDDAWYNTATKNILTGKSTVDSYKAEVNRLAKGIYSAEPWVKGLDAGHSIREQASPYINYLAKIRGTDPTSISLSDPVLMKNLTKRDDKGNPVVPSYWDFMKDVRQNDPTWGYSKEAQDETTSMLNTFGKMFRKSW